MSTITSTSVTTSTATSSTASVSTKTSVTTQVKKIKSNELVRVEIIPYARAQKIYFKATGLRPNCRHFAFFDQVAVDDWCREETFTTVAADPTEYGNRYNRATRHPEGTSQLFSDAQGTIEGSFFLPNTNRIRFRTGDREFRLIDISVYEPNNAISTAFTVFASNGRINYYRDTYLKTSTILTTRTITTTVTNTTTRTVTNTLTTAPTPTESYNNNNNNNIIINNNSNDNDDNTYSYDVDGDGKGDYYSRQAALNDGWRSGDINEVPGTVQGSDPGKGPNSGFGGESSDNSSQKVICGELHRQGLIPTKIYRADLLYFRDNTDEQQIKAYHSWAVPYVKLMKKSTFATRIIRPFGKAWAYEMAYRMGKHPESNLLGRAIVSIVHPVHTIIGKLFFSQSHNESIQELGK